MPQMHIVNRTGNHSNLYNSIEERMPLLRRGMVLTMKKIGISGIFTCILFAGIILFTAAVGICDYAVPNHISIFSNETASCSLPFLALDGASTGESNELSHASSYRTSYQTCARMFGVIPLKDVEVNVYDEMRLYPGGMAFGIKFRTQGVLLVGMSEVESAEGKANPAAASGMKIKDIITAVNGQTVNSCEEIVNLVENCGGEAIRFTVDRDGKRLVYDVYPVISPADGKYKAGIWIRDSTAGIGTVTFIDPKTLSFAGLGHGICDVDTGMLMPLRSGVVTNVTISGITRGKAGAPGELKGYFNGDATGTLLKNTVSGVYGTLNQMPENIPEEALPIGLKDEVNKGDAYIYCTNSENRVQKFGITITDVYPNSGDAKNFVIEVTDPALLELTGGIVQGMSGSPVIQDGKLVGAVTHVLVNDPTRGYGIFIENMLDAAE